MPSGAHKAGTKSGKSHTHAGKRKQSERGRRRAQWAHLDKSRKRPAKRRPGGKQLPVGPVRTRATKPRAATGATEAARVGQRPYPRRRSSSRRGRGRGRRRVMGVVGCVRVVWVRVRVRVVPHCAAVAQQRRQVELPRMRERISVEERKGVRGLRERVRRPRVRRPTRVLDREGWVGGYK